MNEEVKNDPKWSDHSCHLVPIEEIPKVEDVKNVPTDDLVELYKVCKHMEILCSIENGLGLSAVQVGIPWKLFLVRLENHPKFEPKKLHYGYFVNCDYNKVTEEGQVASLEGCLSLRSPDGRMRFFRVDRWKKVTLNGFQLIIEDIELRLKKINIELDLTEHAENVVFQHEVDHQRGILISDYGEELFLWK